MSTDARRIPLNTPLQLDQDFLQAFGRKATEDELRRIVCSIKFELSENGTAVRLLGPDMSYHQVDPYLSKTLAGLGKGLNAADVLGYTSSSEYSDLCFEDSWTGCFIAVQLSKHQHLRDVVLIHLDDHTDMMPTLLCRSAGQLIDPTTGEVFDPTCSADWEAAIYSGAISIGNFITPLCSSTFTLHVRHLNNVTETAPLCYLSLTSREYELIPGKQFAAIEKHGAWTSESRGTYLGGTNPDVVLGAVPEALTLIHIDLDYFINDFNGASRGAEYIPAPELRTLAKQKLDRFFISLSRSNPTVHRWLIATSPGFCSAYHWDWLLSAIDEKIREFSDRQTRSL